MILGNLKNLNTSGLPIHLKNILSLPECSLSNLMTMDDGKLQLINHEWFCHIGIAHTQEEKHRHTEYHQYYVDIQIVLEGEEIINYSILDCTGDTAEEKKPDLFILHLPKLTQTVHLKAGDFAIFLPGEPHQALCMVTEPQSVRKAVFKVPLSMIKERL